MPFGGGTSVVGGVEPVRDGFAAAISLDLRRLAATVEVDRTSLTARLDAGLLGPEAERRLGEEGVTLGHFPQSFEYSTVGGWVATRSAGQASTGYGRIDELVEGVRCVTPGGRARHARGAGVRGRAEPARARGGLRGRARRDLRGDPARAARAARAPLRGLVVRELRRGLRRLPGDGAGGRRRRREPALGRGRDAADDGAGRRPAAARRSSGRRYLRMRGHEGGCLAILGFEGEEEDVERRRRRTAALLRAGGGVALGAGRARRGCAAATPAPTCATSCSTAACSSRRSRPPRAGRTSASLHAAVGEALRTALGERGTPPLVMCHVSHLYPRARRSTSPSWPARRRTRWRSGAPPRPPPRRRSWRAAARSRTTTRSGATTATGCAPRPARSDRGAPRREGAARPGRDHEPREAAAASSRKRAADRLAERAWLLGRCRCAACAASARPAHDRLAGCFTFGSRRPAGASRR